MNIATYNANSLRSRLHIILPWLSENDIDVLCLQEIKVENRDFPVKEFEDIGYKSYFSGMKSYNGVAIICREELTSVGVGLNDSENTMEDNARIIHGFYRGIYIINCYVPQGREIDHPYYQYKLNWLKRLREFLREKMRGNFPVLVCGDFNVAPEDIDVYDPDRLRNHVCFHIDAKNAFKELLSVGLTDLFRKFKPNSREYTFYDYRIPGLLAKNKGWRIDHILVTEDLAEKAISCEIDLKPRLMEKPSDHTFLKGSFNL